MEALNQSSLDRAEFKNFIKDSIKDLEWIETFNGAADYCVDHLSFYTKVFQQVRKVSDDQCDMRYQAFVTCLHLVAKRVKSEFF